MACKARGTTCVMVAQGTPCLGPVPQAGCGAICPAYARGCYGCFGPMESPNITALARQWQELGVDDDGMLRALRTFNANAPAFREASFDHE
jgi:coenzyme F420-reducing hydrogenase gamma subunit